MSLIWLIHMYIKMVHHLKKIEGYRRRTRSKILAAGYKMAGSGGCSCCPNTNGRVATVWRCEEMAVREPGDFEEAICLTVMMDEVAGID